MHSVQKVRIVVPPLSGDTEQFVRENLTRFRLPQQTITSEQVQFIPTVVGKRSQFTFCNADGSVQILQSGKALAALRGSEQEFCPYYGTEGVVFFDRHAKERQVNGITAYGRNDFEKFCLERSIEFVGNCQVYDKAGYVSRVFQQTTIVLSQQNQSLVKKLTQQTRTKKNLELLYYLSQGCVVPDTAIEIAPKATAQALTKVSFGDNDTTSIVFEMGSIWASGDAFIPIFTSLQGPYFVEFTLGGVLKFGDALERSLSGRALLVIGEGAGYLSVW